MATLTKNIEYRIQNIAARCHTLSARLINKEQIIISLQMLTLVGTTSNSEFQQRYLRWALVAYNRALKENALPVDKDFRRLYGESFSQEEIDDMLKEYDKE